LTIRGRFIVDQDGKKTAAILDIEEYERLLEELEDLEDIRALEAAIAEGGESVPWEEVIHEIGSEGD
jgi:antitoxin Phd